MSLSGAITILTTKWCCYFKYMYGAWWWRPRPPNTMNSVCLCLYELSGWGGNTKLKVKLLWDDDGLSSAHAQEFYLSCAFLLEESILKSKNGNVRSWMSLGLVLPVPLVMWINSGEYCNFVILQWGTWITLWNRPS
jgi:hypothetical protein